MRLAPDVGDEILEQRTALVLLLVAQVRSGAPGHAPALELATYRGDELDVVWLEGVLAGVLSNQLLQGRSRRRAVGTKGRFQVAIVLLINKGVHDHACRLLYRLACHVILPSCAAFATPVGSVGPVAIYTPGSGVMVPNWS